MSSWTTTQVLIHATFQGQKRAFQKLVRLAYKCYAIKNYSSAAAITAGLENYRVDQLCKREFHQKCMADKLDVYERSILLMLRTILNPCSNFKHVRGNLNKEVEERKPHLPILLIYLNDLYNTAESSRIRHNSLPDYMFPFDLMRQEAIVKRKYDHILSYKIPETDNYDLDLVKQLRSECQEAVSWLDRKDTVSCEKPASKIQPDTVAQKLIAESTSKDSLFASIEEDARDSIKSKSLSGIRSKSTASSMKDLIQWHSLTSSNGTAKKVGSGLVIGIHNNVNNTSHGNISNIGSNSSSKTTAFEASPTSQYYKLYRMNDSFDTIINPKSSNNSIHYTFHTKRIP